MNKSDIVTYYDQSKNSYRDVWHLDTCLALHYGFWGKGIFSLRQALIEENKTLAGLVDIKPTDVVLDAGCGVGGSSIFLAKTYSCRVYGISLSADQVGIATSAAQKYGVSDNVVFTVADYHQTSFDDDFFDVIWFVESFCHSNAPDKLLQEMYRILKPNGRLIIADGFLTKSNYNRKEQQIMDNWLHNWAINTLPHLTEISAIIEKSGYRNMCISDYSSKIAPSSFLLYLYANMALFYGWLLRLFGKNYGNTITIKNTLGAKYQFRAFRKKLWTYSVVAASK